MSQEVFSERIRRDQTSVSKIEKGEMELSPLIALSICNAFGVRKEWLLEGKEPKYDDKMKLLEDRAKELGEDIYFKYKKMKIAEMLRGEAIGAIMENKAHYGSYDELADPELYDILSKVALLCEDKEKKEALKRLIDLLVGEK
jgi:transcriptional regulator with XRE-family HTH domain